MNSGDRYKWIKGDKFGITETVTTVDENSVHFHSGGSIFLNFFKEYFVPSDDLESDIYPMPSDFKYVAPNNIQSVVASVQKDKNDTSQDGSIVRMLLKGNNLESKKMNISVDISVPTKFIVKGLMQAYGLNDIETDYLLFIKEQVLSNLDNICRQVMESTLNKIKNTKN